MSTGHPVHAIILTGGRSTRMGGRHKPALVIGGQTVIDRTVRSLWTAAPNARITIAGSDEGLAPSSRAKVMVIREAPPFSGPVAGLAAAVDAIPTSPGGAVLLLGGDLPLLTAATLGALVAAVRDGAAVAGCRDSEGRFQFLCTAWRQRVLHDQLAKLGDPANKPLRAVFAGMTPHVIDCDPDELRDIDTPDDLAWAAGVIGD